MRKRKAAEYKEASARKAIEQAIVMKLYEEQAADRALALATKATKKEAAA